MKIKFKALTKTSARLDICCFSGRSRNQIWEFDKDEVFEVKKIIYGEYKKIKTRPGLLGGRFRVCNLILKGKNENTLHPDYLADVPESAFEVIEEHSS